MGEAGVGAARRDTELVPAEIFQGIGRGSRRERAAQSLLLTAIRVRGHS